MLGFVVNFYNYVCYKWKVCGNFVEQASIFHVPICVCAYITMLKFSNQVYTYLAAQLLVA